MVNGWVWSPVFTSETSVRVRSIHVTDTFGRAEVETWFAFDARKGQGRDARFVIMENLDIPLDADLTTVFASEHERNRQIAGRSGVVVAAVGVDKQNSKLARILMSEHEPTGGEAGKSYEIRYLAQPRLETPPNGAG
jgi:Domain of unknown function (DUF4865)